MKKIFMIFLLSTLTTFTVHAAKSSNSPWYIGFIGGFMDGGRGVTDDAINLGFNAGYQVNRYFAPELELTRTLVDGETSGGNDWDVDTLSIFAAFRTDTKIKLKAKIGVSDIDTGSSSDTEWGWTAGGGIDIAVTDNFILGAEVLYFDLGSTTVAGSAVAPFVSPAGHSMSVDYDHNGVIARARASYKF